MRSITMIFLALFATVTMQAQDWTQREVSGIKYDFPKVHQPISTPEAYGVYYNERDVYLSVTSLPDTSSFRPDTRLERSRYYAATAASVTLKLRGKMVANADTMVGDKHLYYTSVEVAMTDSTASRYDLLQYMLSDTLHGFSAQYLTNDKAGVATRDHFFNSIVIPGTEDKSGWIWMAAVGIVILLGLAFFTFKNRSAGRKKTLSLI